MVIGLYVLLTNMQYHSKNRKMAEQVNEYSISVETDRLLNTYSKSQNRNISISNLLNINQLIEKCKLPQLDDFGHKKTTLEPTCKLKKNWGDLTNHKWKLSSSITSKISDIKCKYRTLIYVDDFKFEYSRFSKLVDNQTVQDEVIEVKCQGKLILGNHLSRNVFFENVYPQIIKKVLPSKNKELFHHVYETDNCTPLNVILISYDSVSRISWIKRLPKSFEYITKIMGFEVFDGYNIGKMKKLSFIKALKN
jgi:hypothetical protein